MTKEERKKAIYKSTAILSAIETDLRAGSGQYSNIKAALRVALVEIAVSLQYLVDDLN